jgi:protein-disulfide isomerase
MSSNPIDSQSAAPQRGRPLLVAILVLAAIGLGVAVHLTRIHYYTHTDPSYHSICAVNEKVNCETVAESAYSVFVGLPISVWGLLAYALAAALAVCGLSRSRLHPTWPFGALLCLSAAALAGSAVLAFLSFFLIDSMCIFCMILYAVNAAMFGLSAALAVRSRRSPLALVAADLSAAVGRPIPVLALAAIFGGAAAAAEALVPPYWVHLGWSDLPDLPVGVDEKGHYWIGAERPRVIVTEFSDYECPHCRRAHRNMRQITARYAGSVRLVHRHQPLDDACNPALAKPFHRRACEFSRAVECAGAQGAFWAMNDALFSVQDEMSAPEVEIDRLAVGIGLDRSKFRECLASEAPRRKIAADIADAERRHVSGTPTYFIGAQAFPGGFPESILAAAVKNAKLPPPGGVR